eukprot:4341658-Prymnesium_polylepis.1
METSPACAHTAPRGPLESRPTFQAHAGPVCGTSAACAAPRVSRPTRRARGGGAALTRNALSMAAFCSGQRDRRRRRRVSRGGRRGARRWGGVGRGRDGGGRGSARRHGRHGELGARRHRARGRVDAEDELVVIRLRLGAAAKPEDLAVVDLELRRLLIRRLDEGIIVHKRKSGLREYLDPQLVVLT